MKIKDRDNLISDTISRIINNAPVSEILRVYSTAVNEEVSKFSDETLVAALQGAGYVDLIEKYVDEEDEIEAPLGEIEDDEICED